MTPGTADRVDATFRGLPLAALFAALDHYGSRVADGDRSVEPWLSACVDETTRRLEARR